ncbi:MAG TPA: DNA topoisomerase I [Candidatus Pacearchaeota archaeon]|nr:DNA topoisomerase I [Candidatus Pacearchaeota archaeon]
MPRKKIKKSKEQKTAEEFFPIRQSDLKHAVEKEYKPLDLKKIETVEKVGKPKAYSKKATGKKTYARKTTKTAKFSKTRGVKKVGRSKASVEYVPPKVNLKKGGYELIITEKPQAALKIAAALGKSIGKAARGVSYYEINRQGKRIIVACAVGHLFTLTQRGSGAQTPVFDLYWVPNYLVRKNDFTKKYYDTLLSLAKDAESITIATDYDVEGEVIGLNIVRYLCGQKDANRMKFSTLTTAELNKAYEEKSSSLSWGQAIAGETRHYLDWIYGINLSRALMDAIKTTGKFRIMSVGRVQGPTLNIIVQKERKINEFESQKYWQVFIKIKNSHEIELKHVKDLFDKDELKKFNNLLGKTIDVHTEKKSQQIPPNPPFNLTTLQTEAYRLFGFTPARTLQIAQSLYLAGLISYPRTSSQKLPEAIGYKEILKKLSKIYHTEKLAVNSKPVEGKKSDPAHPSIYPTGETSELSGDEAKIYDLVVKRFLALFCEDAIVDGKTISGEVEGLKFATRGSSVKKKAWMEIYPVHLEEKDIPDMNGTCKILDVRNEEKETQPPKRYSQASLLSELEKRNLGTKATRAAILETLYAREYVRDRNVEATPLGMSLIATLEKYSPVIIDEELTRSFEKEMETISSLKKDFDEKKNKVIKKAQDTITKIIEEFQENKEKIGKALLEANIDLRRQQKEENTLTVCPVCKKGNLAITYSRKTQRHFVACDAYPNCKTTFSLPPNGVIKKTGKICESCGFPTLIALRKGKKPWIFCFNTNCESNKKRLEEYREKKAAEQAGADNTEADESDSNEEYS